MCTEKTERRLQQAAAPEPLPAWTRILPCLVGWPSDATDEFLEAVSAKYLSAYVPANCRAYGSVLARATTPREAVDALQSGGAFATLAGRVALTDAVAEARAGDGRYVDGVLDTVERYALYAFVLSGSDVTCGALPAGSPIVPHSPVQ